MSCGQKLSLSDLQALARQVGFPESEIAKVAAIGIYESGGCTNIINDGSATGTHEYSVGLYQINLYAHNDLTAQQLMNPLTNMQYAYQLWLSRPSYADWYNSNIKYKNDYQGIASLSQMAYGGGNGGGAIDNSTVLDNIFTISDVSNNDNTGLYILLGLAAFLLLK